ncbi:hypothetical protein NXS19_012083 [Fusarium pseudograminearum]|nr:hypothetical protein NXS19_012083 [Fusarium pseudograminearum]
MQVIVAVNPGPSWIAVKGGQVSPGSNVGLGVENLGRAGRRLTNSLELRRIAIMHEFLHNRFDYDLLWQAVSVDTWLHNCIDRVAERAAPIVFVAASSSSESQAQR